MLCHKTESLLFSCFICLLTAPTLNLFILLKQPIKSLLWIRPKNPVNRKQASKEKNCEKTMYKFKTLFGALFYITLSLELLLILLEIY